MAASTLNPQVELTSYWRGRVYQVRQSIPNTEGEHGVARAPAGIPAQCGACGGAAVDLVSAHNESGTAWQQYYCQYQCRDCGKFTVYHFDD